MKADNTTTAHNRTIHFTEISDPYDHKPLPELLVTVNYVGEGNADKGITLDAGVLPALVKAVNEQLTDSERRLIIQMLLAELGYFVDSADRFDTAEVALAELDTNTGFKLLRKLEPTLADGVRDMTTSLYQSFWLQ